MSIWGHRDSEPQPEEAQPGEAHQTEPEGRETQEPAGPEHPAEEPAPAFWRAQGETPSFGRAPAAAPPLAYGHVPADAPPEDAPAPPYGRQAPGEAPAPAVSESPAGTGAPVPVLTGKVVVLDGETVVQDPALTGMAEDHAGPHDAEAGDQAMTWGQPGAWEPSATDGPEPTVTWAQQPGAPEPSATDAPEPAVTEAQQPGAWEPSATDAPEPAVTWAQQPGAPEPSATGAPEPAVTETQQPAATEVQQPGVRPAAPAAASPAEAAPASADGISAQRWSEILVAFVDDPHSSVQMAAGAVDEAIDEFVNSVRARQRALASSWQGTDTGTEQLRTALRDYRKLWHQVRQLDLGEQKGA